MEEGMMEKPCGSGPSTWRAATCYLMESDMNFSAALPVSSEPIAIVGNINLDISAASFSEAEGWIEVPAIPVKSAVSATGCGDVFCAAHMLLGDLPARDRLETSARIAAEHLNGARVLIPRLIERAPPCRNKDDQAPSCAANDPRL